MSVMLEIVGTIGLIVFFFGLVAVLEIAVRGLGFIDRLSDARPAAENR